MGLPEQWFTATVLIRDIAVVGLMVLVVRQIYRPAEDLVRMGGRADDPSGGVFDEAADSFPARWPQQLRPTQKHQEVPDAGSNRTVPARDGVGCGGPL